MKYGPPQIQEGVSSVTVPFPTLVDINGDGRCCDRSLFVSLLCSLYSLQRWDDVGEILSHFVEGAQRPALGFLQNGLQNVGATLNRFAKSTAVELKQFIFWAREKALNFLGEKVMCSTDNEVKFLFLGQTQAREDLPESPEAAVAQIKRHLLPADPLARTFTSCAWGDDVLLLAYCGFLDSLGKVPAIKLVKVEFRGDEPPNHVDLYPKDPNALVSPFLSLYLHLRGNHFVAVYPPNWRTTRETHTEQKKRSRKADIRGKRITGLDFVRNKTGVSIPFGRKESRLEFIIMRNILKNAGGNLKRATDTFNNVVRFKLKDGKDLHLGGEKQELRLKTEGNVRDFAKRMKKNLEKARDTARHLLEKYEAQQSTTVAQLPKEAQEILVSTYEDIFHGPEILAQMGLWNADLGGQELGLSFSGQPLKQVKPPNDPSIANAPFKASPAQQIPRLNEMCLNPRRICMNCFEMRVNHEGGFGKNCTNPKKSFLSLDLTKLPDAAFKDGLALAARALLSDPTSQEVHVEHRNSLILLPSVEDKIRSIMETLSTNEVVVDFIKVRPEEETQLSDLKRVLNACHLDDLDTQLFRCTTQVLDFIRVEDLYRLLAPYLSRFVNGSNFISGACLNVGMTALFSGEEKKEKFSIWMRPDAFRHKNYEPSCLINLNKMAGSPGLS